MGRFSEVKLKLTAFDGISKPLEKITRKLKKMRVATGLAKAKFNSLKLKTESLRRSLNKVGGTMRSVGRTMTTRLSLPIGLAGAAIIRTSFRFQKAMNSVAAKTQTTIGVINPLFKQMENQAKKLGETTEFSAIQVAEAMSFLAQAGFDAKEVMGAIAPTLDLAAASATDLATTGDILSNIMGGFGLAKDFETTTRVADVLALTTAKTNTNLEQLGEAMSVVSALAKSFGASLETTSALAGFLGNVGIQGTRAGTTLKSMFTRIAAPAKKARDILADIGIEVQVDKEGNLKDINAFMKEFGEKISGLGQRKKLAVISEVFGLRAIAGGAAIIATMTEKIKEGKDPIAAFTEQLLNAGGAAKAMREIMQRGTVGEISRFNSALEAMGLAFAESGILTAFSKLITFFTTLFRGMAKLTDTQRLWIASIFAAVAILGPMIAAVGGLLTTIGGMLLLKAGLVAFGLTFGGIALSVGLIAAKFALVAGAIGIFINGLLEIKGLWDDIFNSPGGFGALLEAIGFTDILGGFKTIGSTGADGKGLIPTMERTLDANINLNIAGAPRGSKLETSGAEINTSISFAGGFFNA